MEMSKDCNRIVALAGNPNVGKSTVFNQLTGLRQHTGNWPGKTVANARGYACNNGQGYILVDVPGCYSLMAHSAEEEAARDFVCFEKPDAVVVVCDATCLERNMNLVIQVLEVSPCTVVCVNLMDEADKKQIHVDLAQIEQELGVPVIGTAARSRKGLNLIFEALESTGRRQDEPVLLYPDYIERAVAELMAAVREDCPELNNPRWYCLRLLDADQSMLASIKRYTGSAFTNEGKVCSALEEVRLRLKREEITEKQLKDDMAAAYIRRAEEICKKSVQYLNKGYNSRDRKLDRLFTSKLTGFPIMFLLLLFLFWLTIAGANYPSQWLSALFGRVETLLFSGLHYIGTPSLITDMLVSGVYRVLAWVISVMLPPMAIFFPLFTLLEDFGYLPRVAFNLDRCFQKCRACGKQALTMCMGFGCNAAGIIGCRIIDSPRERLIAMLTNNFVPCNGRFPILIAIITMFFVGAASGFLASFLSAVLLAGLIMLGILMTFVISRLLSATILKGIPSSFTLELPPYRRPQAGRVIVRSVLDRTVFVLGRAAAAAAPAGPLIWIMANTSLDGRTLLAICSGFLDPFARLIGMDGVILLAFILGLPANEIVIPVIIMAYMANGSIVQMDDLGVLKQLFVDNGWTFVTAISTMLFALMHWPCSTTCLTIRKETGSVKWMAAAFVIPALTGFLVCFLFTSVVRLFNY